MQAAAQTKMKSLFPRERAITRPGRQGLLSMVKLRRALLPFHRSCTYRAEIYDYHKTLRGGR